MFYGIDEHFEECMLTDIKVKSFVQWVKAQNKCLIIALDQSFSIGHISP